MVASDVFLYAYFLGISSTVWRQPAQLDPSSLVLVFIRPRCTTLRVKKCRRRRCKPLRLLPNVHDLCLMKRNSFTNFAEHLVDTSFENVNLDEKQETPPTNALAPSISNLRMGWKSQLSLHSTEVASSNVNLRRLQTRSLASSSTPNLVPDKKLLNGDLQRRVQTSSAIQENSSSPKRVVEGRYRSRLEKPMSSSRLKPLFLVDNEPKPPRGVLYDANMEPGVSMTVQNLNGELLSVRSPITSTKSDYFSPKASAKRDRSPLSRQSPSDSMNMSEQADTTGSDSFMENLNESSLDLSKKLPDPPEVHRSSTPPPLPPPPSSLPDKSTSHTSPQPEILPLNVPKKSSSNLTRMPHLPPKPRAEEAKHLAAFSRMMQESKQAEKQRTVSRRFELQKRQEEEENARILWEREILPSWTRALEDPKYRDLWWGGIPQVLRARLWPRACGNDLMLSHNLFARAMSSVQKARATDTFPQSLSDAMRKDIANTLPSLRLFDEHNGPLFQDLFDVLSAYVYIRADEASQREGLPDTDMEKMQSKYMLYVPGIANLAALLVMNLNLSQSLIVLLNLIAKKNWLKAIYGLRSLSNTEDRTTYTYQVQLQGYERVFNALLAERMPDIYANLHKAGIRPADYVREWIRTLFVPWVEIDTAARLWDVMYVPNCSDLQIA